MCFRQHKKETLNIYNMHHMPTWRIGSERVECVGELFTERLESETDSRGHNRLTKSIPVTHRFEYDLEYFDACSDFGMNRM